METSRYLAALISVHLETLTMHTVVAARNTVPLYSTVSTEIVRGQFQAAYRQQAAAFAANDPAEMIAFVRAALGTRLQQGAAVSGLLAVLAIIEATLLRLVTEYPPDDPTQIYRVRQQIQMQFQAVRLALTGLQLQQISAAPLPRRPLT